MTVPNIFVDPTVAWNEDVAMAAHPISGAVFYAILIAPSGGVDTMYVVVWREDINGQRREVQRWYARDSRSYLNTHGGDGTSDEGKYGRVALAVAGDDLVLAITMRANGMQRTWPTRLAGKAK